MRVRHQDSPFGGGQRHRLLRNQRSSRCASRPGSATCRRPNASAEQLYDYFMDRNLGLLQVRVQTSFPLQVQIYLNDHEWLASKLTARGIEHAKIDNVFSRIGNLPQAQRLAIASPT